MHFMDDSLLPENQEKLVIQVAPYGPEWFPEDSDDIPVTMDEQIKSRTATTQVQPFCTSTYAS